MKPEREEEMAARVSALRKQGAAPADCLAAAKKCNRLVLSGASLALADSAIELLRDCRSRIPADSAEQPALLATQANSWRVRYLRNGDEADLRQAVAAVDEAYALAGPEHPLHAMIRHGRATVYELVGGPDRIGSRHRITAEDGDAHPDFQIRALLCTITELLVRHNRTQDTTALDEALALAERALNSTCGNDGERWWLLMRAAQPYAIKATRTHDVKLVTKSIELLREALSLLPAGDAHTAGLNNELGACLHIRAKIQHDPDELAAALRLLHDSVNRTPPTSVDYAPFSSNLVTALRTLWKRERDPAVLGEAIRVATAARDSAARNPTSRQHLEHLEGLIGALTAEWSMHCPATPAQREQAKTGLIAAMGIANATPSRVLAGRMSIALAAIEQDWRRATELSGQVIDLLPHVASEALFLKDRERGLAGLTTDLARDACACALNADSPQRALELLEQGRATLIDQALSGHRDHDLDLIRPFAPAEVQRMAELRAALEETAQARDGAKADRRHTAADEILRLTQVIRSKPGLERYLLPSPLADLRARLGSNPLVVINVSRYRCDALIVTGVREVSVVPLPALTAGDAAKHAARFTAALNRLRISRGPHDRGPRPKERKQLIATMWDTLAWLWEAVAEPVLTALGITAPGDDIPPRVRWSPTGPLTMLPLHAAGYDGSCVMDRVVSSYVPTLRLIPDRDMDVDLSGPLLIVSVPDSALMPEEPIRKAALEAEELSRMFPGSVLLRDDDASAVDVLAALARTRRVHFACHGETDPHHPSRSYLVLQREPLAVAELMRRRLDLDLAVLSACHTARGSDHLPDEMLHLVSAFQVAGVRHTVGTLWAAGDDSAMRFTDLFYRHLQAGRSVAVAVHLAVNALREERATPAAWAPFIHVGF